MSDKRLRILIIPSWYPNEFSRVNGTFIEEHAKAIALYNEVFVFYPYFYPLVRFVKRIVHKNKKHFNDISEGNLKVLRVRIPYITIPIKGLDFLGKIFFMLIYTSVSIIIFKKLYNQLKPDIVHCHVTIPAGLIGALISKIYKIPLVISEHAGPFSQLMPTAIHKRAVKYSIDAAAIILPVSAALKRQINSYFTMNNFEIIPNTVDMDIFYFNTIADIEAKTNILFVGLFHEIKGIPVLLEAISLLYKNGIKNFTLNIIGDNNDYLLSNYKNMTDVLGIKELVVFHGQKTKKEIAEFMRNCSFLVLPSLAETFGCVVIEALSCGKPVLATKCGGPEELINKENGLLVSPGDVVALKDGLKFMLENYYKFDSEKISREAKALYSHEEVGKRISEIYLSVIEKNWLFL
jgi:glycosyltransferase involved in cell wall biosynthesis